MAIVVYNTLSRRKEEFVPLDGRKVRIYTCGLTVQDYCHIGHARMDVVWDFIKNWLRYRGYEIYHVVNFTDLNEKIAAKAVEAGVEPLVLAERFIQAYLEDMQALGIQGPDRYVRVSEEIPAIIELIEDLVAKGHAYPSQGNVYFRVESFPAYGRLSGRRTEELQTGTRIAISGDKESPEDFALWTVTQPGEPQWQSPWGPGTPGWHIECSAMSMRYLGESYDMHGGGMDLLFPHHENELAQSCAYGSAYAKYWLHHGIVNGPDGTKMSKSLNNFFRVRDILAQCPTWILRYFLVSTHYRSPITFGPQLLEESKQSFARLQRLLAALAKVENEGSGSEIDSTLAEKMAGAEQRFGEAMDDDFNTAAAIAVLFELSRDVNTALQKGRIAPQQAGQARLMYLHWGEILGFRDGLERQEEEPKAVEALDTDIEALIADRQAARVAKDWARADELRAELDKRGIILIDTPQGVTWKRK